MKLFTLFWRNWLNPKERKLKAAYIVYIPKHRTSPATSEGDNFIVKAIPKAIILERNVPLVKKQSFYSHHESLRFKKDRNKFFLLGFFKVCGSKIIIIILILIFGTHSIQNWKNYIT